MILATDLITRQFPDHAGTFLFFPHENGHFEKKWPKYRKLQYLTCTLVYDGT